MEAEEEVDILMSSDVYSANLSTKSISFSRSQIGWLFREDKTVSGARLDLCYVGSPKQREPGLAGLLLKRHDEL